MVEDCIPSRFRWQPKLLRGITGGKVEMVTTRSTVDEEHARKEADSEATLKEEEVMLLEAAEVHES